MKQFRATLRASVLSAAVRYAALIATARLDSVPGDVIDPSGFYIQAGYIEEGYF